MLFYNQSALRPPLSILNSSSTLQSMSPVRIITPAECIAQNRALPPLVTNAGTASMLRFIPSGPSTPCEAGSPKPQSPKMFYIAADPPPTYEEAMQMALESNQASPSQSTSIAATIRNDVR